MLAGGRNPKERTLLGIAILWATVLTLTVSQCAGGDRANGAALDEKTFDHGKGE